MSKKVCFRKEYCPGKIPKRNRRFHCPANTNDKCEIIPKRPRMARVKAALTHIPKVGAETQMVSIDPKAVKAGWIPCTILIDKKYLRRKP